MLCVSYITALLAAMTAAAATAAILKRDESQTYVVISGNVTQLPGDVKGWDLAQDLRFDCENSGKVGECSSSSVCRKGACLNVDKLEADKSEDGTRAWNMFLRKLMDIVQQGSDDTLVPTKFQIIYRDDATHEVKMGVSFSEGDKPGSAQPVCDRLDKLTTNPYIISTHVGGCPTSESDMWPSDVSF